MSSDAEKEDLEDCDAADSSPSSPSSSPPSSPSSYPTPVASEVTRTLKVVIEFLNACGSLNLKKMRKILESETLELNDFEDEVGQNGFHYAVCSIVGNTSRQISVLKYLRTKGLDVNKARTTDQWTPIYLAVTFGLKKIVSWLLSKGAKIEISDSEGRSPEEVAASYRLHKIKDILIHHRSRVPHSRFSCVVSGPPLSSPSSPTTPTTPTTTTDTTSSPQELSSSTDNTTNVSSPPVEGEASSENSLLTAAQ